MSLARREEILDALVDIFREQGIGSDFTMSRLAKEVNIGKSTIYEYFKTKEDIVQQAISRVIDQAVEVIYGEPVKETNFEDMFKNELQRLYEIAQGSRFLFNLISPSDNKVMSTECQNDIRVKINKVRDFYLTRFQHIFTQGIMEGLLNPQTLLENQMIITSIIIGNIMQLANGLREETNNIDVEDLIDKVYKAVLKIVN